MLQARLSVDVRCLQGLLDHVSRASPASITVCATVKSDQADATVSDQLQIYVQSLQDGIPTCDVTLPIPYPGFRGQLDGGVVAVAVIETPTGKVTHASNASPVSVAFV